MSYNDGLDAALKAVKKAQRIIQKSVDAAQLFELCGVQYAPYDALGGVKACELLIKEAKKEAKKGSK